MIAGSAVVSGIQLGNVWIGVQPALGVEGDPMRLLFDRQCSSSCPLVLLSLVFPPWCLFSYCLRGHIAMCILSDKCHMPPAVHAFPDVFQAKNSNNSKLKYLVLFCYN